MREQPLPLYTDSLAGISIALPDWYITLAGITLPATVAGTRPYGHGSITV